MSKAPYLRLTFYTEGYPETDLRESESETVRRIACEKFGFDRADLNPFFPPVYIGQGEKEKCLFEIEVLRDKAEALRGQNHPEIFSINERQMGPSAPSPNLRLRRRKGPGA